MRSPSATPNVTRIAAAKAVSMALTAQIQAGRRKTASMMNST